MGDNKSIVRRLLEEALSTSNLDLMDELLAASYVGHALGAPISDREQTRRNAVLLFTAFPDLHVLVNDLLAEDDVVVVRYTISGTQWGEISGISPSGKHVAISVIDCYRAENGQIREGWGGVNELAMLRALGGHYRRDRESVTVVGL